MPTLPPELQQRVNLATESLAQAERELLVALQSLSQGERSDKVMISTSLGAAFEKVSVAKAALAALVTDEG